MRYSKKKSIVLVAMLFILSLCFLSGCNPGSDIDSKPSADTFKIIEDKAKSIEYEELKKVFADIKLSPSDVIMDVGCGRGRIFNYLLKNNFKGTMYGVEIDREIALFTKNRLKNTKI